MHLRPPSYHNHPPYATHHQTRGIETGAVWEGDAEGHMATPAYGVTGTGVMAMITNTAGVPGVSSPELWLYIRRHLLLGGILVEITKSRHIATALELTRAAQM